MNKNFGFNLDINNLTFISFTVTINLLPGAIIFHGFFHEFVERFSDIFLVLIDPYITQIISNFIIHIKIDTCKFTTYWLVIKL